VLVADAANNIEVRNASTLQPAGQISVPNLTPAFLTAGGGAGFATSSAQQILRFDPVTLQVTGTATLPGSSSVYLWNYSQPVLSGSMLYVPFQRGLNGGPRSGAATPPSSGSAPTGIAVIDTTQMTLTAIWPFQGLPLLGLGQGGQAAYAVVPAAGSVLELDKIDLATGQTVAHVQLPGQYTDFSYSNPAASPDGRTVYLSNNNALYTFDAQTLALTGTVPGIGLVNLAVSPDGDYLYGNTPVCNCATQYTEQIVSTSTLVVAGSFHSVYQPGPALFVGN
jgi:hypothetical protein